MNINQKSKIMNSIISGIKNVKTFIIGLIPFVVAILNQLGIIDVMPQEVTDGVGHSLDSLVTTITAFVALIGLFARDADKSSEQSIGGGGVKNPPGK